jgi:AbrB family looped-hinge helix DNA binding protein
MAADDLTDLFMGSVTVGERGQVVIPAEARERLQIKSGDKLLVLAHPTGWGVSFVRFDRLQQAQASLLRVLEETKNSSAQSDGDETNGEESV